MKELRRDSVSVAIMANRFDSICREMEYTVLRAGRSANLSSARDFSCAIVTADGRLCSSAEGLPVHVVGMEFMAQAMTDLHSDLDPGDAFLHNDPYLGNTHAADHCILVPVFAAGEHRFTALVKAHQADCGNSAPTTYMPSAGDVYEEGALTFPCVHIQKGYNDVVDIVRMCRSRIRVPEQWYGDYLAMLGGARVAQRRLGELLELYGADALSWFIEEWFSYSERRAVQAIADMPAARITAKGAHDPFDALPNGYDLTAEIVIDPVEGYIDVDLTENGDCVDAGVNLSRATSTNAATTGVLNCLDPSIPHNDGCFKRIRVKLRDNCAVGIPKFPASCSLATTNLSDRVVNMVGSAIAQLGDGYGLAEASVGQAPGYAVISGNDPRRDGAPYVNQLVVGGGGGPGGPGGDGWVNYGVPATQGLLYRDSVEVLEQKFPIMFEEIRVGIDTEGAGRHRGAPATRVSFRSAAGEVTANWVMDGYMTPPQGAAGGLSPAPPKAMRRTDEGGNELEELPPVFGLSLTQGESLIGIQSGGGGYGDPLDRDPQLVRNDVLRQWVSFDRARDVYGVVFLTDVLTDELSVDLEATKTERERVSSQANSD